VHEPVLNRSILERRFQMDRDCLFDELRDDGTYTGPCEVTLDDPPGRITGRATVHVSSDSRTEIKVTIEKFEAPPEFKNNLLAFLYASPPKLDREREVVSVPAATNERPITFFPCRSNRGPLLLHRA
jgi:hypothetical protein